MVSRQRTPVVICRSRRCLSKPASVLGLGSVLLSTGMEASAKGTASRSKAKAAAAWAMKGEWKAPETANGIARLQARTSLTALTASGLPESTTWASLLSLAITTPSVAATSCSSWNLSNPITAVIAPPPAAAISSLRRCIKVSPVSASNTPAA